MELFKQKKSNDISIKKDKNRVVEYVNPIVDGDNQYDDFIILLDEYYPSFVITQMKKWIVESLGHGCDVTFIYPFKYKIKKSEVKEVIKFYRDTIELESYIKPYSKVITVGRSLYSIIKADDLELNGFYDLVFDNNHFWSSDYKSRIFPVDNAWSFFKPHNKMMVEKDCWETFFFKYQIKQAYDFKIQKERPPKLTIELVNNPNEFLLKHRDRKCKVSWDTETRGTDAFDESCKIICATVSFDGRTGYYLRWDEIDPVLFGEFLDTKESIGQNLKYDIKFVALRGVPVEKIHVYYDSWNGSHCCNEMQRSSLKSDAWIFTHFGGYDRELDLYKEKYPECKDDYGLIPEDLMIKYATMDAIINFQIYEYQLAKIRWIDEYYPMDNGWSLERYYFECHIPAIKYFIGVELEGMYINWDKLEEHAKEIEKEIVIAEQALYDEFKVDRNKINFSSTNDLGTLLECLGWPEFGRSKTKTKKSQIAVFRSMGYEVNAKKGVYLTGDPQLTLWAKNGYKKQTDLIEKYRELSTMYGTFMGNPVTKTGYFQYKKSDGKMHPTFKPMLTNSHRNACGNPNLQNVIKHGDYARWYREIFVPPSDDYYIDEKDAAGFQLRIGAIYSQDPELIKVFTELGGDLHSMTAQSVLRNDLTFEEFIAEKKAGNPDVLDARYKAKGINFQLEFGASAFNFAMSTIEPEWPMDDVVKYIKDKELSKKVDFFKKQLEKELEMYEAIKDRDTFPYLWAVSSDIRKKYFTTYARLKEWIHEKTVEADQNGFVRSSFGCIRRLPQLIYQGKDDLEENGGRIKNWHNIAVNSPVQNYEAVLITWTGYGTMEMIKRKGLKSIACGNVHDSLIFYTYKDEFKIVNDYAKSIFEEDRPENMGIPQILKYDLVDYGKYQETRDGLKPCVWGFGVEDYNDLQYLKDSLD